MARSRRRWLPSALAVASILACAPSAHAMLPPPTVCIPKVTYHPAVFVGLNAGDAILYPRPQACAPGDGVCTLFVLAGLYYTHVALSYDGSGTALAESQWDENPPPSTDSTGGDHPCSRVLDSARLQSLNPGTTGSGVGDQPHTVGGALVIPGFGRPYCTSAPDGYHFNSFLHDDVQGGSCEKYVVDYCGVPVQPGDRPWVTPSQMNAALTGVYQYAYEGAMGTTSQLPWYLLDACGGVDDTILSQRAAFQVINEIRWKWWELVTPDGDSTDTLGVDTDAEGVNVTAPDGYTQWENLGAGSQNTQWTGTASSPTANSTFGSYCTNVNISNQTPNGVLQGEGASCPSWQNYGSSAQINAPDAIYNAAVRMGLTSTVRTTKVAPAYVTYTKCP